VSADGSLLNEVDDRHERQRRAELYAEVIEDLPEVAEERIECLSAVPDVGLKPFDAVTPLQRPLTARGNANAGIRRSAPRSTACCRRRDLARELAPLQRTECSLCLLIRRCIAWRNRHAQDRMLREVVKRAYVA
jgi:hypothetical protein